MIKNTTAKRAPFIARLESLFTTRDFIFHDGRDLRRFSVEGKTQALLAGVAGLTLSFSAYGVAQAAVGAVALTGIVGAPLSPEANVQRLHARMTKMQGEVEQIRRAAAAHAARVEHQQAVISAVVSGQGDDTALALAAPVVDSRDDALAGDIVAPLKRIEQ
ncbi:hypothetical protein BH10PSE15_BH10PSE15_16860 [soil metagenome]